MPDLIVPEGNSEFSAFNLASPLAAIIASMVWAGFDNQLPNKLTEFAIAASIITVFSGFLMVSNFKFYSFKELDRGRVPFAVIVVLREISPFNL